MSSSISASSPREEEPASGPTAPLNMPRWSLEAISQQPLLWPDYFLANSVEIAKLHVFMFQYVYYTVHRFLNKFYCIQTVIIHL
jgi:hypothetical protein